jgi:branched-chain amino acid transport system permease protein
MASDLPIPPDVRDRPRIGVDEWVAGVEGRREGYRGFGGQLQRGWDRLPLGGKIAVLVVPAAVFPLVTNQGNVFRYGLFTLVYGLLALGLNIVVGFAGLLDLGYVAFFGFGAYTYGIFASPQFHHHFQGEVAIPIVVAITALAGLLVGLPSRRLVGDYLAILTLFFGQAFVIFVNNEPRINWPFFGHADFTGGSNGLAQIDPLNFFGYKLGSTNQQYYFLLGSIVVVLTFLYFLNDSRTGRAWRALREDPLAAELMSMPVNRLKLMAFVFGAAVAGFTGAIYATVATAAVPGDYDVGLLITIYAIMILGGFGSIMGILVGAVIVSSVPELLRSSANARPLFYGAILVALLVKLRPWRVLAGVLAALIAFGFAVHAIAAAAYPRLVHEHAIGSGSFLGFVPLGWLAHAMNHWMLFPRNPTKIADFAYVIMIAVIVALSQMRRIWRLVLLPVLFYLVMFSWENLLIGQISGATRLILLGALLVALMNARPQGLFGQAYVEIV